jgi:hypothetical protein
MCSRLRRLWQLLRDPAAWSAEHYRRKNRMDFAALRRDFGRSPPVRERS